MSQKFEKILNEQESLELINYCLDRYGVPVSFWTNFLFLKRKEGLWVIPNQYRSFIEELFEMNSYDTAGLRLFSGKNFPYKVTHQFPLFVGSFIQKGKIHVSKEFALKLLFREPLEKDFSEETHPGYYFVYYKDQYIGIALLSRGQWVSQVPKSLTAQLPKSLDLEVC